MKTVADAQSLILSHANVVEAESVRLRDALRRVLREDAVADMDSPAFDCSAMDGYALSAEDADELLAIVAEIQPGDSREIELQGGECARIFTGAKMPAGADCVLMQEDARIEKDCLRAATICVGENVRKRGENCWRGDLVVKAGRRLNALDLAALASCGIAKPRVSRRPRVTHFVTGNELVEPSQTPVGSQIRDCNSTLIASLLAEHGAELAHQSRLPDDFEKCAQVLSTHDDFDVLLISGGASVGDYDFARPLLEKTGFDISLNKVNVRPGRPLVFGTRGRQLAFGLPGNPVSHAVIFHLMLAPLFAAMTGAEQMSDFFQGHLDCDFSLRPNPRETYWPCRGEWREGAFRLRPLRFQSSGDIAGVAVANALLRIPPNHPAMKRDDTVNFLWLQSP